jgi:hypothetical protein
MSQRSYHELFCSDHFVSLNAPTVRGYKLDLSFDGTMEWKSAPRCSRNEPLTGPRLVSLMYLAILLKVADEIRVMEENSHPTEIFCS